MARVNVTAEMLLQGKDTVAYFEGTPILTCVVLAAVLAVAAWQGLIGEEFYCGVWSIGP